DDGVEARVGRGEDVGKLELPMEEALLARERLDAPQHGIGALLSLAEKLERPRHTRDAIPRPEPDRAPRVEEVLQLEIVLVLLQLLESVSLRVRMPRRDPMNLLHRCAKQPV